MSMNPAERARRKNIERTYARNKRVRYERLLDQLVAYTEEVADVNRDHGAPRARMFAALVRTRIANHATQNRISGVHRTMLNEMLDDQLRKLDR